MKKTYGILFLSIFLLAVSVVSEANFFQADPPQGTQRLLRQINRVTRGMEGKVGLVAVHIESGESVTLNGDEYFPLASVFKVPIFVDLMAQIKEGEFSLEDEISIQKTDQHLGSGMLATLDAPGITLSIRNLVNMMMKISDNSATDIIFNMLGPDSINNRIKSFGIEGITVNRSCQHLIMDVIGLNFDEHKGKTRDEVLASYRGKLRKNPDLGKQARKEFSSILQDQSTPSAMTALLEKIFSQKILDAESCKYIIDVMLECDTGKGRLKGELPPGTAVAHKTGTIGGTVNDVGIIYLPDGMGHVAVSIFFKDTTEGKTKETEEKLAKISRFIYDYFYFTAPVGDGSSNVLTH